MKLKTFAGRAAAAGAVLVALVLAALPVWAAPRVQVDKKNAVADHADILSCLLYTSPSPRDGLLSRMPSSA